MNDKDHRGAKGGGERGALNPLVGAVEEFSSAAGAAERIFEVIDTPVSIVSSPTPIAIPEQSTKPLVEFVGVSFSYPSRPEQEVLRDVSFVLGETKTLALVGPSGGGKSTIASLIPRYYDPSRGTIRYKGIDLIDLDPAQLRAQISIVDQYCHIFSLSIAENIRYGRLDATEEEIKRAARLARLDDFIESLPQKYDTPVGDKGLQLSGGQRQRLAIARAILKNPALLILDEATSSLDSENESLVQAALTEVMQGRTTLIIAHRLSTVQHADTVLVVKDGEIIQEGKHESLYAEPGLYRTLVEHQLL